MQKLLLLALQHFQCGNSPWHSHGTCALKMPDLSGNGKSNIPCDLVKNIKTVICHQNLVIFGEW
jgi:hypothetical protein